MSEFDSCCVCYEEYDLQHHIAVALKDCHHIFGKQCVDNLLKSANPRCPKCRMAFSNDPVKYSTDRQIREKVEYKMNFERCQYHGKPLDLYCETDKCKICMDCLIKSGENSHNGHTTQRIMEDLRPKITLKERTYEQIKRRWETLEEEGRNFLGKRRLEDRENLKTIDKITKTIILEKSLKARTLIDIEESKLEQACSDAKSQIEPKIEQCKDLKHTDLKKILDDTQDVDRRFEAMIIEQAPTTLSKNIDSAQKSVVQPAVSENSSNVSIKAPGFMRSLSNVRTYIDYKITEDLLELTAGEVLHTNVDMDFENWRKKVKKVAFVFNKFNFNEEDLELLNYIFCRLQDKIKAVSLQYQDITEASFETNFENHMIDFSRLLFASSQVFQSIGLSFIRAKGSDRFVRCLTERIRNKSSNLLGLKIQSENSDLKEKTLVDFVGIAETSLKDLASFYLILNQPKFKWESLSKLSIQLPGLKELIFRNKDNDAAPAGTPIEFLMNSLICMRSLEKCKLELPHCKPQELKDIVKTLSAPNLASVTLTLPRTEFTEAELNEIQGQAKENLHGLQTLRINELMFNVRPVQREFSSERASNCNMF